MDQKILNSLEQIGLTKTEIKVYLTLLDLGIGLAGKIADKSNVYRKNAYDALNSLHKKGLVGCVVKSNRKNWQAMDPQKISEILAEKAALVDSVLPELQTRFKATVKTKEVVYFEGRDGMKSFYYDMYKENKNVYMIGATGKAYTQLKYFISGWIKKMNKCKTTQYVLWNYDSINRESFMKELKSQNRIMPKNFSTPTQIFIYGNKSAIVMWSSESLCVLIKSKDVAEGFKKYFKFMWKISKVA